MANPKLQAWFNDYESYHRHPKNKLTHYFGVPLITVSLLGLLSQIPIGPLNLGLLFWGVVTLWYLRLDWKIGLPFSFVALLAYALGQAMPTSLLWIVFVGGWILQLWGHYAYEKRNPAFFTNLRQTVIAPLWMFAKLFSQDQ